MLSRGPGASVETSRMRRRSLGKPGGLRGEEHPGLIIQITKKKFKPLILVSAPPLQSVASSPNLLTAKAIRKFSLNS